MKHYSIGELIHAIKDVDTVAYCYRGETEGMIVRVNPENNRLAWVDENGVIRYDFHVILSDIPEEEGRRWVFFHELDDDIQEELQIKVKIAKSLAEGYLARLEKAQHYADLEKEGKYSYNVKLNILADCDLETFASKFDEFIKSNGWEKDVYKP